MFKFVFGVLFGINLISLILAFQNNEVFHVFFNTLGCVVWFLAAGAKRVPKEERKKYDDEEERFWNDHGENSR